MKLHLHFGLDMLHRCMVKDFSCLACHRSFRLFPVSTLTAPIPFVTLCVLRNSVSVSKRRPASAMAVDRVAGNANISEHAPSCGRPASAAAFRRSTDEALSHSGRPASAMATRADHKTASADDEPSRPTRCLHVWNNLCS